MAIWAAGGGGFPARAGAAQSGQLRAGARRSSAKIEVGVLVDALRGGFCRRHKKARRVFDRRAFASLLRRLTLRDAENRQGFWVPTTAMAFRTEGFRFAFPLARQFGVLNSPSQATLFAHRIRTV